MPETEYSVFLTVKEMKDKYDYMQEFNVDSKADIAKTLAVFGAFTEGLQLFASFAMLMNFPRFNKMKGMGQIVTWSVRDETLHCNSIIKLFRTFVQENPEIWTEALQREIYVACSTIVDHEDAFIDLAFEIDGIEGMTATDVKRYIRFIADRRLHPARPAADLQQGRQEPAALDGPDAERHRAHQLLREPLDGVFQGLDQRDVGRGVFG